MEHRISRRKTIYGYVALWQGDTKCGDYELANVSAGGLFLKCSQSALNEGEIFTIKFHFDNQSDMDDCYLKVIVVHRSEDGAGLMLAGCQTGFPDNIEIIPGLAA